MRGSPGKGLLYGSNNHTRVICYSDGNWAGSSSDRRSNSGYCVFIMVTWFLGRVRYKVLGWDLV